MDVSLIVFGYVGPETLVPAASALAAIIGGFLAFGRTGWLLCRRGFRLLFRRDQKESPTSSEPADQDEDQPAPPSAVAA